MNLDFVFCIIQCFADHWVVGTVVGVGLAYSGIRLYKAARVVASEVKNMFIR